MTFKPFSICVNYRRRWLTLNLKAPPMHPLLHLPLYFERICRKKNDLHCVSVAFLFFAVFFFCCFFNLAQSSSARSSKSCWESQVHGGGYKRLQSGTAALSRRKVHLLCGQQAKVEKCIYAEHVLSSACWPHNEFLFFFSLRLRISVPLRYSIYFVARHAANTGQLLYWAHLMNNFS